MLTSQDVQDCAARLDRQSELVGSGSRDEGRALKKLADIVGDPAVDLEWFTAEGDAWLEADVDDDRARAQQTAWKKALDELRRARWERRRKNWKDAPPVGFDILSDDQSEPPWRKQ